ncbi:hypothetical protein EDB84DRAFT_1541831, partial [Lactarius hengduanensis]
MIRVLRSNRRGRRAQRNAGEISTVKFGPLHVVIWRRVLLYLWCCCGASCGTTDVSFSLHRAGSDFALSLGLWSDRRCGVCTYYNNGNRAYTPALCRGLMRALYSCGYEERIGSLRLYYSEQRSSRSVPPSFVRPLSVTLCPLRVTERFAWT